MKDNPTAGKQQPMPSAQRSRKSEACEKTDSPSFEVDQERLSQKEILPKAIKLDALDPKLALGESNQMLSYAEEEEVEERYNANGTIKRTRRRRSLEARQIEPKTAMALAAVAVSVAFVLFVILRFMGKI
jgi:hypothetical protein